MSRLGFFVLLLLLGVAEFAAIRFFESVVDKGTVGWQLRKK